MLLGCSKVAIDLRLYARSVLFGLGGVGAVLRFDQVLMDCRVCLGRQSHAKQHGFQKPRQEVMRKAHVVVLQ